MTPNPWAYIAGLPGAEPSRLLETHPARAVFAHVAAQFAAQVKERPAVRDWPCVKDADRAVRAQMDYYRRMMAEAQQEQTMKAKGKDKGGRGKGGRKC